MPTCKRTYLSTLLCATLFTTAQAGAAEAAGAAVELQDSDAAPATQTGASARATTLDSVMVTAQKRSERAQDVPVSLTAITADQLVAQNALRLQDYLAGVPGTSVNDLGFGRSLVVIRGVSTGLGNNPTTGFTIDDVPVGSSNSSGASDLFVPNLDPSDLQHIEVLRGPQGTLYGASAMGGLVKYVTADPDPSHASMTAGLDATAVAHGGAGFGVRAGINLPAGDRFALRASGFFRETPGFMDDPFLGLEDLNSGQSKGARVAALWQVAPNVVFKLSALAQDQDADGSNVQDVYMDGEPIYGDLTRSRLRGADSFSGKTRLYAAHLDVDLGWASLSSITGYNTVEGAYPQDVSGNFRPFTPMFYGMELPIMYDMGVGTDKLTQELRLASQGEGRVEWMLGGFFTRETGFQRGVMRPTDATTGQPLDLPALMDLDSENDYRELAAFGNLTYRFTERFDVAFGARHSRNDRESWSLARGLLYGNPPIQLTDSSGNATTFLLSPRFRVSDSLMAYLRVASGYRPGGSNSNVVPGLPPTYGEDKTVNYELGVKGDAWDRRINYSANLFFIDWSDIQIRAQDPATALVYYSNAGQARSRGAELAIAAMPLSSLTLDLNLSYTDAELTEDAPPGTYAPAGSRLPISSKWSSSFSMRKDVDLTASVRGFGAVKVVYTGDRLGPFTIAPTAPRFEMPGYATVDLSVGAETGEWTTTVFVRNVADKRGYLSAQALNSVGGVGGAHYVSVVQPRTFGFSISTTF